MFAVKSSIKETNKSTMKVACTTSLSSSLHLPHARTIVALNKRTLFYSFQALHMSTMKDKRFSSVKPRGEAPSNGPFCVRSPNCIGLIPWDDGGATAGPPPWPTEVGVTATRARSSSSSVSVDRSFSDESVKACCSLNNGEPGPLLFCVTALATVP